MGLFACLTCTSTDTKERSRRGAYEPSTPLQSTAQGPPRRTNRGSQTWVRSDSNPGPPHDAADHTEQQSGVAGVQIKSSTNQLHTASDQSRFVQPADRLVAWSPGLAEGVAALRATTTAGSPVKQTDPIHEANVQQLSDIDVQVSALTPAQSLSVQNVDSLAGADSNEGGLQLSNISVQTVSTMMPPPLLNAHNATGKEGTDVAEAGNPSQLLGLNLPPVLSLTPPQPLSTQNIIHRAETASASVSTPFSNLPGTCLVLCAETQGTDEPTSGPTAVQAGITDQPSPGTTSVQAVAANEPTDDTTAVQADTYDQPRPGSSFVQAAIAQKSTFGTTVMQARPSDQLISGDTLVQAGTVNTPIAASTALQASASDQPIAGITPLQDDAEYNSMLANTVLQAGMTDDSTPGATISQTGIANQSTSGTGVVQAGAVQAGAVQADAVQADAVEAGAVQAGAMQAATADDTTSGTSAGSVVDAIRALLTTALHTSTPPSIMTTEPAVLPTALIKHPSDAIIHNAFGSLLAEVAAATATPPNSIDGEASLAQNQPAEQTATQPSVGNSNQVPLLSGFNMGDASINYIASDSSVALPTTPPPSIELQQDLTSLLSVEGTVPAPASPSLFLSDPESTSPVIMTVPVPACLPVFLSDPESTNLSPPHESNLGPTGSEGLVPDSGPGSSISVLDSVPAPGPSSLSGLDPQWVSGTSGLLGLNLSSMSRRQSEQLSPFQPASPVGITKARPAQAVPDIITTTASAPTAASVASMTGGAYTFWGVSAFSGANAAAPVETPSIVDMLPVGTVPDGSDAATAGSGFLADISDISGAHLEGGATQSSVLDVGGSRPEGTLGSVVPVVSVARTTFVSASVMQRLSEMFGSSPPRT